MELSIITVTLNDKETIADQIRSVIMGTKNISFEQWIIDNGSSDETPDHISHNFPGIKIIRNSSNTGFGHANNQGAKNASGDFLLFLNPDMRVEEGSLDKMVTWMKERPEVGIASCRLIDQNGHFNDRARPRRLPTLFDQVMILLKIPHLFPRVLDKYMYAGFNDRLEQEVESVRGSFMLMRRSLYEKLGWAFDPRYYIWFEDVDICRECRRNGFKVVYTPIVNCVDYVGQTFKKMPKIWKQKNFTKSMLQYFQKWEPWYKWCLIAVLRPIAIALAYINK